jgi:hypothetical protein
VSKFLINLLVQISKALAYSKIQFLSEKKFSSTFGPMASQPIHPIGPERPSRPSQPTRPCPPSPSSLPHRASGATTSSSRAAVPWAPRCPSPKPWRDPNRRPLHNSVACLYSIINPPLFTTCNQRLHGQPLKSPSAPPPPSGPYKRRRPSPVPILLPSSSSSIFTTSELLYHRRFAVAARPSRRLTSPGERRAGFTVLPSPHLTLAGELPSSGAVLVPPNLVVLVPKFLESLPLSFYAFI